MDYMFDYIIEQVLNLFDVTSSIVIMRKFLFLKIYAEFLKVNL